jgi:hypothetical protein
MSLAETWPGEAGQTPGYEQAGPTVVRMLLGTRLRKLRESAGISQGDAGYAIRLQGARCQGAAQPVRGER